MQGANLPRVLVVDADSDRRHGVEAALVQSGMDAVGTGSGREAIRLSASYAPAALVVIWPVSGSRGGLELLASLRSQDWRIFVAVMGIGDDPNDVREVLEAGADLCWPRACGFEFLALHIQSALRRRDSASLSMLRTGDITIDMAKRQAWRGEGELLLTPIELRLLSSLMKHAGEVVSKATLLEECWRRYDDVRLGGGHLVEVHVASLRRKLHARGESVLQTVRGQGFVLRPCGSTVN